MEIYRYDPREGETVIARRSYAPGRAGMEQGFAAHGHDYCEVFWVERGMCWHQVRHTRRRLAAGDCVFIRASDVHHARCVDRQGFTIVNLTLRAAACTGLRQRYGIPAAAWPWRSEGQPHQVRLARPQVRLLAALLDSLPPQPHDAAVRDLVVLAVVQAARATPATLAAAQAPPWLAAALGEPAVVAGGFARLVQACGRSPAHLNRTVRRCFGTTASDLLARLRIEEAARRLALTDASILDIALACGFTALGHFYRRFVHVTGTTPRRYRLRAQRGVQA